MLSNPSNTNLSFWFHHEFDSAFAERRELLAAGQETISWQEAVFTYPRLSAFLLQQYRTGHENLDTYHQSYARYSALCQELPVILSRPAMPLTNEALITIAYALHRDAFDLLPRLIKRRLFADPLFDNTKIAISNSSFFILQILREKIGIDSGALEPFEKNALGLFFQREFFFNNSAEEAPIVVIELCQIVKNPTTPLKLKEQLLRVFLQTAHKPEFIKRCQYLSQENCRLEDSLSMLRIISEQQLGAQLSCLIGSNTAFLIERLPSIENFYHDKFFLITQKKSAILAGFLALVDLSERSWQPGYFEVAQPTFSTRYSPNEPLFFTAMVSATMASVRSFGRVIQRLGMEHPFALEIYDNTSWRGRVLSFSELIAPALQAVVALDMQRHRITYFLTRLQGRRAYSQVKNEVRLKVTEFLERLSPESTVNQSLYELENIISSVGADFKYRFLLTTFEAAPLMSVADYDNRCVCAQNQIRTQVIELLSEIASAKAWLALDHQEHLAIELPAAPPSPPPMLTFSNQAQQPETIRAPSPPR